jgi:hypothetical protein
MELVVEAQILDADSPAPQTIPTPDVALLPRRIERCERIDLRDL